MQLRFDRAHAILGNIFLGIHNFHTSWLGGVSAYVVKNLGAVLAQPDNEAKVDVRLMMCSAPLVQTIVGTSAGPICPPDSFLAPDTDVNA